MTRNARLALLCLGAIFAGCAGPHNPFTDRPRPSEADDDEVRVGYGTQDREDVTGAVSSVSMAETAHMHDILELLRSQVPGLQVTERPDGSFRLRLRGAQQSLQGGDRANQPLIVIDGMPLLPTATALGLKGLNPKDVKSISVLKDVASTSIYGSKGANGVILIALKR